MAEDFLRSSSGHDHFAELRDECALPMIGRRGI